MRVAQRTKYGVQTTGRQESDRAQGTACPAKSRQTNQMRAGFGELVQFCQIRAGEATEVTNAEI